MRKLSFAIAVITSRCSTQSHSSSVINHGQYENTSDQNQEQTGNASHYHIFKTGPLGAYLKLKLFDTRLINFVTYIFGAYINKCHFYNFNHLSIYLD